MMHPMLNIAIQAARQASRTILRFVDQLDKLDISTKSANDFVTQVDKQAEEILITDIQKAYPKHAFYTEELTHNPLALKEDFCWIIDPLDGTRNFIHGLPHFCISIALMMRGQLEVALIYDPIRQDLFTATRGQGAYLNSRRIRVSPTKKLSNCLLGTGLPFHNKEATKPYLKTFENVFMECGDIRRMGSAALDLAYVACGRLDGFWESDLDAWDVAAGALLVKEAGGIVTNFGGGESFLLANEIVAANNRVHKELLTALLM